MDSTWFKSTFSGSENACVEIAHRHDTVLIRDSKYVGPAANQPTISVPAAHWPTILDLALNMESGQVDSLTITVHPHGGATLTGPNAALIYTPEEWDAFAKGIADNQFDRP